MKKSTLFDIISPVMAGPSSSHTAGAVRLGLLARNIYKSVPKKVVFKLYNSYARTGKGHGTDKGLLAGILGLNVDDRRIKDIFNNEISKNVEYSFEYFDNFRRHPNAVDIELYGDYDMKISGDSIGAGEILITKINDFNVSLSGNYNTLIIVYKDKPGMISFVTSQLQGENINIASLSCDRSAKGQDASMIICIDGNLKPEIVERIQNTDYIYFVTYVEKLEN